MGLVQPQGGFDSRTAPGEFFFAAPRAGDNLECLCGGIDGELEGLKGAHAEHGLDASPVDELEPERGPRGEDIRGDIAKLQSV